MHTISVRALLIRLLVCFAASSASLHAADTVTVAHRGAWKALGLPENSLASLRHAIGIGCAGAEFDVWMTSDDSLVVNHDPLHQGMPIEETSYGVLRSRPLANGELLPSLREYLRAGLDTSVRTRLVLEVKPSRLGAERGVRTARAVVRLAREFSAGSRILFISFDGGILAAIRDLDPGAELQYLNGDKTPEELRASGINGADYHLSVYRKHPEWIGRAKACGIALNAWTVNSAADMDWLIGEGFTFITTNEPELLKERLDAFGHRQE
ncbi:MAG: glycerophosphodiester phosphodiesterase family protein [Acidobacteriota bacterium]